LNQYTHLLSLSLVNMSSKTAIVYFKLADGKYLPLASATLVAVVGWMGLTLVSADGDKFVVDVSKLAKFCETVKASKPSDCMIAVAFTSVGHKQMQLKSEIPAEVLALQEYAMSLVYKGFLSTFKPRDVFGEKNDDETSSTDSSSEKKESSSGAGRGGRGRGGRGRGGRGRGRGGHSGNVTSQAAAEIAKKS
jgi:uncharacterized membrane protein YgcG